MKNRLVRRQIKNTKLTTPLGKDVKLSEIASLKKTTSPDTITRENDKISVSVDAKLLQTMLPK